MFLTLLLVFKVLIKGGSIALVACETSKRNEFLAILGVFNSTEFEDRTVDVLDLLELLRILLFELCQKLEKMLDNNAFKLFKETIRLKSFTRNIERKIIGFTKGQVSGHIIRMYERLYRRQQP